MPVPDLSAPVVAGNLGKRLLARVSRIRPASLNPYPGRASTRKGVFMSPQLSRPVRSHVAVIGPCRYCEHA